MDLERLPMDLGPDLDLCPDGLDLGPDAARGGEGGGASSAGHQGRKHCSAAGKSMEIGSSEISFPPPHLGGLLRNGIPRSE